MPPQFVRRKLKIATGEEAGPGTGFEYHVISVGTWCRLDHCVIFEHRAHNFTIRGAKRRKQAMAMILTSLCFAVR